MRLNKSLNFFPPIIALFLLTACASTSNLVDISGSDKTSFTVIEVTYGNPGNGTNIMFRASQADAAFTQTVPDPKYLEWPSTTIYGPTDIDGIVDIRYASLALGFEATTTENTYDIPSGITGRIYVGLNQTDMNATFTHPSAEYRVDDKTTEFYTLFGISFPIAESLRGGFTYANSIGQDVSGISELDVRADYLLTKNLGIMAGFRSVEYSYNVRTNISDIIIKFRGPFAGLNIMF